MENSICFMIAENITDEFDRVLSTVIDAEWKFNDSLNMDGKNLQRFITRLWRAL